MHKSTKFTINNKSTPSKLTIFALKTFDVKIFEVIFFDSARLKITQPSGKNINVNVISNYNKFNALPHKSF